jgi:phosphatidate phosphatase APP1
MAYTGPPSGSYDELSGFRSEGREPGARRKKLAGYLKAANELRQSYFSQDDTGSSARDGGYESGVEGPGAFPDAAVVRSGNEEMILFPSYARKHVKRQRTLPPQTGQESEQDYWRREWERHQDDNAIVDVDVRGWIYTPHRGPITRKQRLMIGLARQMVGIPAPPAARSAESLASSQASSRAASPHQVKQEEELIAREAEHIVRKGEHEQRYARRGAFSEAPNKGSDVDSLYENSSAGNSRASSPERINKRLSAVSTTSSVEDEPGTIQPLNKQNSMPLSTKMSHAELTTANNHLLNRLKPFMANPVANTPISAFFYNESASRQHTVYTDASGHFTCRAALDFTPTHVRVLASERLSATEEVLVTSPKGVSLISDIDDTIKHSAISAGAREIFRNAFIRELGDLTIEGVREWYNTMHDMGVKLHYVSNSPWQMYPVLTSYFKMAHLPKGSFHLKQYSGMLQGIFEPVAERKKASLDKIMRDFPDRKFILVGDSGEADLEVYTEAAMDNPGRVIGIFIRDVTTPIKNGGYFDGWDGGSMAGGGDARHHVRNKSGDSLAMSKRLSRPDDIRDDDADLRVAIAASLEDMEEETRRAKKAINPDSPSPENATTPKSKPAPPPPRRNDRSITQSPVVASPEEDLIDFTDDPKPSQQLLQPPLPRRSPSPRTIASREDLQTKPTPSPPPKPQALRSPSPGPGQDARSETTGKTPPPRPRKPSSAVKAPSLQQVETWTARPKPPMISTIVPQVRPSPLSQVTQQSPETPRQKQKPPLPERRGNSALQLGLATTHKAFAPANVPSNGYGDSARAISTSTQRPGLTERTSSAATVKAGSPAPPPRLRNVSNYTTTTRKNRLSGGWDDGAGGSLPGTPAEAGMSKKEFLWNQRWARAKSILERQGVTLRSWRTGADVADVCVRLAEQAIREIEKESGKQNSNGRAG